MTAASVRYNSDRPPSRKEMDQICPECGSKSVRAIVRGNVIAFTCRSCELQWERPVGSGSSEGAEPPPSPPGEQQPAPPDGDPGTASDSGTGPGAQEAAEKTRAANAIRLEELHEDISFRLRPVCEEWPVELFDAMVSKLARITLKYELVTSVPQYDRRRTDKLVGELKSTLERSSKTLHRVSDPGSKG